MASFSPWNDKNHPPPLPQHDVLLSTHFVYRTLANEVYDNEVRPEIPRSMNLNIEAIKDRLRNKLKKHLGDKVPRPNFWISAEKATENLDSCIPGTEHLFSVGKIGCQTKHLILYIASDSWVLNEHRKGNGRSNRKKKRSKTGEEDEERGQVEFTNVENCVAFWRGQGEKWASDSDSLKHICLGGFKEDLRKIREWQAAAQLAYNDTDTNPVHFDKHMKQLQKRFNQLVEGCYHDMVERFLQLADPPNPNQSNPTTVQEHGSFGNQRASVDCRASTENICEDEGNSFVPTSSLVLRRSTENLSPTRTMASKEMPPSKPGDRSSGYRLLEREARNTLKPLVDASEAVRVRRASRAERPACHWFESRGAEEPVLSGASGK